MSQKLITACIAAVAFAAFTLPASASATNDPQLTDAGVLLSAAGNPAVVGTNSGVVEFTTTSGSTLATCTEARLAGRLVRNSGSTVELEVPAGGATFSGTGAVHSHNGLPECTTVFGSAYITVTTTLCIRSDPSMTTDRFRVYGGACGIGGKFRFIIGSTTAGGCSYETNGSAEGTYTTGGTETKMSTTGTSAGSGSTLISGGFLCPSSSTLKMTFAFETPNGTKLTIS